MKENKFCFKTIQKSILIIMLLWVGTNIVSAQNEFITTWLTDNSGTSGTTEITIPTNSAYTYNYDVDWDNDGVYDETGITGDVTHDFGTTGTYTIRIQGTFPAIYFNNSGDKEKIISIDQWGSISWSTFNSAFYGCSNMNIMATDAPDLSLVSDFAHSFRQCYGLNADLSNWDVSTMTNAFKMFQFASSFNGDITTWTTGNLTNTAYMFNNSAFNQDIGGWDVSKLTNMTGMFQSASFFNQDISSWNTESLTNTYRLFYKATNFNQDISAWNITNVSGMDEMLDYTAMSTQNYDKLLTSWSAQNVISNVNLGATGLSYCNAENYRDSLITNYGWSITDNGQSCEDTDYFITTWKTNHSGTSGSTEITIPTNSSYTYSYDVDWDNDGTFDEFNITGDVTHDFGTAGTYTIRIKGTFPAIYFNGAGDCAKLTSIDQWGSISWQSMVSSFTGCSNLDITAPDAPDLRGVTSLEECFQFCSSLTANLSNWDVSTITNMRELFEDAILFNGDLSSWDVSSVTTMYDMFEGASSFNQDIGSWNVSSVTTMRDMFEETVSFNQDLNSWNVSAVTSMREMFHESSFSGNISSWDVSNVSEMRSMFQDNTLFNSDVSSWDVSNVEFMDSIFEGATNFNQDISAWEISNVNSMYKMLDGTAMSTQNYDKLLTSWSALSLKSGVSLGAAGLSYCSAREAHETLTNTYGWTINDEGRLCADSAHFVITIQTDSAGTSGSTSFTIPTKGSETYNYDVDWDNDGVFDTLAVTGDFTHDFGIAGEYTIRIQGTFPAIYFNNGGDCQKLIAVEQWGNMEWETMYSAFRGCSNMNILASDAPDLSNVNNMNLCFYNCSSLDADLSSWDVSNVLFMTATFAYATSFNGDISTWNISMVENTDRMFQGASSFNVDISSWDVSSVSDMSQMFENDTAFNADISSWNLAAVATTEKMFNGSTAFNQDLNSWNVKNVADMTQMFQNATSFNGDVSNWNVTNVEDIVKMFYGASSFNQDVSGWDIDAAVSLESMFEGATSFNQNIGLWDISHLNDTYDMYNVLNNTNLSSTTYDATLEAWADQAFEESMNLGTINAEYCSGKSARNTLISGLSWTINDNGLETEVPVPDEATLSDIEAINEVTSLTSPTATDNCTGSISGTHNATLPINPLGTTIVTWTYEDGNGNTATQTQNVIITDGTAPVADEETLSDISAECEVTELAAPTATENFAGTVVGIHEVELPITTQGTTIIIWTYDDGNGNTSTQTQNIVIKDVTAPVPAKTYLSGIEAECEITELTAPTATDNCDGVIIGTHDADLPITAQDVTMITWTFTDAAGNKSTQEQFISLNDITVPVADVPDLDTIYAINELTELSAPTATDNCVGAITGTHNVTLPITTEGTTEITWEYVDDNGNTTTQAQYVVIEIDDEAPVADVETLSNITAECEVTELTAPTATDNFSGTVTGNHNAKLPINSQGTTIITWTYMDENGNTSTQTQNVVIEDVTKPTIICPDDQDVIANNGTSYIVDDGEFELISFDDNCSLVDYTNDFNNESELAGESLPLGENVITWTIGDGAGNTSTCSHKITVNVATGMDDHLQSNVSIYPNPANDYITVKTDQIAQFSIYGLTGQLLKTGYTNQRLDISDLSKGIYLVKIEGVKQVSKISKQ